MKSEFNKQDPPFELSAAISGYEEIIKEAYDFPSLSEHLDFMSVMTYDYHGSWENVTGHVSPAYYKDGDEFPTYNMVRFTRTRARTDALILFHNRSLILIAIETRFPGFDRKTDTEIGRGPVENRNGSAVLRSDVHAVVELRARTRRSGQGIGISRRVHPTTRHVGVLRDLQQRYTIC